MSNKALLLVEEESLFSPISQLNYGFYQDKEVLVDVLHTKSELQCLVGQGFTPFGQAQNPEIGVYADAVDTLSFLSKLS
jgi:hypothetical protein